MKKIILLMMGALMFSHTGLAEPMADVKILGTYSNWTAYRFQEPEGPVCYMASEPVHSQGKYTTRDDVFLTVTHRPAEQSYDVVSMSAGFTYKKGSKPNIHIDKNKTVTLLPSADTAWARDAKTDADLVAQMIKGSNAYLNGISARGTNITDTFSLKGFSKAYQKINEACKRK